MKTKNGMIVEMTESELRDYWLTRGWDDFYDYPTFREKMVDAGVEVTERKGRTDEVL